MLKFEKSESPPSSKGLSLLPSYTHIPGHHESAISMFILSNIIRFYTISTKNFLGKDPHTPLPCDITCTFYKAKTIIPNVFYMEEKTRDVIFIKSIVCKAVSMTKIDFDHTKAIDIEAPYPLFVCVCVCFFFLRFFFACQKFLKVGHPPPPTDENSWIRACSGFVFSN